MNEYKRARQKAEEREKHDAKMRELMELPPKEKEESALDKIFPLRTETPELNTGEEKK